MSTCTKKSRSLIATACLLLFGQTYAIANWQSTKSMEEKRLSWDASSVRKEGKYIFVMIRDQSEKQEQPGFPVTVLAISCREKTTSVSQMGFWEDGSEKPELSNPNPEKILDKYKSNFGNSQLIEINELARIVCK